jgi:replicative DNA helicase
VTDLNPAEDEDLLVALLFAHTTRSAAEDALDVAAPEDFYSPHHGAIWKAAKALHDSGQRITGRDVKAACSPSAAVDALVDRLSATRPSVAGYPEAVREVARCGRLRQLDQALQRSQQRALLAEDPAQAIGWAMEELANLSRQADTEAVRFDQLLTQFLESLSDETPRRVFATPWDAVNEEIAGGLHGGRFYVLGARPGEGKSLAAHNMAIHAAARGHEALIFSVEMDQLEVTGRIVASGARVEMREIVRRDLSDYSYSQVLEFAERARPYPLSVVDKPDITIPYIKSVCRNHRQRHGLGVVVIDYLQLITPEPNKSREQQVSQVSRQLKILARELNIAVVVPAQLNRETVKRSTNRPVKSDLRESGGIEADADVIMLLARGVFPPDHNLAGEYNGEVNIYIDKNRHGRECHLSLPWRAHYATIG